MKILYVAMKYDYGNPKRGYSFEHYNFFDFFKSYLGKTFATCTVLLIGFFSSRNWDRACDIGRQYTMAPLHITATDVNSGPLRHHDDQVKLSLLGLNFFSRIMTRNTTLRRLCFLDVVFVSFR